MVLYCRGLAGFLLPSSDFGIAMKGGECGPYINRVIDSIPSACVRATKGLFGFIGVTILNGWMPGVSCDLTRMVDLEAAWCLYKDCFPGKLAPLQESEHALCMLVLVALSLVETCFQPQSISSSGCRGLAVWMWSLHITLMR